MKEKKIVIAFNVFVLVFLCVTARAQQTNIKFKASRTQNTQIEAVPAPGAVTIDGKADDWDLSGGILSCMDVNNLLDKYSGKVYMMYDADALYVFAKITDNTPLRNGYDPEIEPVIVHRGDCLYLRFKDESLVKNLFGYYQSNKQVPQMVIADGLDWFATNKFSNGIKLGVKEAFLTDADGKGYTQEIRIPWSIIRNGNTKPNAGDEISFLMGIYWSNQGDREHFIYNSYDVVGKGQPLPGAYYWTAGDVWGKIKLTREGNLKSTVFPWLDPLPSEPQPLAFSYKMPIDADATIALMNDRGKMVRHLVIQASRKAGINTEKWNGLDDIGNPLPPGKYTWKGIYHKPITTKYVMGMLNSGQPTYKVDGGTGQWGSDHEPPTTVSIAGNDKLLAWTSAEAGTGIIRIDKDGKKKWGKSLGPGADFMANDAEWIYVVNAEKPFDVLAYSLADARPLNFGNGKSSPDRPFNNAKEGAKISGLAMFKNILYVSYRDLNMVVLFEARQGTIKAKWTVPAPGQLSALSNGKLVVLTKGNKAVLIDNGKLAPLIAGNLDQPEGITADKIDQIYISNKGALQNVSVFSSKGKYLRSIGIKGGRPVIGAYNAKGMKNPNGIAIDNEGKLWVAEKDRHPKRFSVWDTKTGKLHHEFFGATAYCTSVSIDPKNTSEAFCLDNIVDINLEKGTWYPKSNYWYLFPPKKDMEGTDGSSLKVFTATNGKQFGYDCIWGLGGVIFRRDGLLLKPFLSLIKRTNGYFLWQDLNNDQVKQPAELSPIGYDRFSWVDHTMTIWSDRGWKLSPSSFDNNGRPFYDIKKLERLPQMYMTNEAAFGLNANAMVYSEGGLFTNDDGSELYTIDGGSTSDELTGIRGYTRDGQERWFYHTGATWPKTMHEAIPKPGQIYAVTKPMGVAGGFLAIMTYFGVFNIFTTDGLFVAKLFHDGREGVLGPETICAEMFVGDFIKTEKDGKFYMLGGDTDGRITEIEGLNTVEHFDGTYEISPADATLVEKEMAEYKSVKSTANKLVIVKGESALSNATEVSKDADAKRGFSARMSYDDKNVYVQYDVRSNSELINAISDPHTIFKGGNLIDIQIGVDNNADPNRKTPAPGDKRLLISRQNDKPYAVLFQPKLAMPKEQPIVLVSPTGREQFAAIDVVSEKITIDYHKNDGGFVARVAIPLELLGWSPKSGSTVKIDLGYLFGSAAGNSCGLRLYWTNKSFSSGVIGDVPNESRLEPGHWGSATVE